jgi:outer membrane protein
MLGLVSLCSGCIPSVGGKPAAPPKPDQYWQPPKAAITPDSIPQTPVPSDVEPRLARLTLADVVDVALSNNPLTRVSYFEARAAGATIGAAYAAYLPTATATALAARQGNRSSGTTTTSSGVVVKGSAFHTFEEGIGSVSWLLFSFGEVSSFDYAKQATFAASFNYNAAVQTAILTVEQAYFSYNSAKAIVQGDSQSVREDSANLAAAQARRQVGVATNSDVLQAQTTLSQAVLTMETDLATVQTTRGSLAVAMGLPATVPYDIAPEPPNVPIQAVSESVDTLVERAVRTRPDLAAFRAQARQAQADVGVIRGQALPTLNFTATANHTNFDIPGLNTSAYLAEFGLSIPVLNIAAWFNVKQASELAKSSVANAEYERDVVINEVFTSYYTLQTATARVKTSDDLLASAQASYDLALGQYKQGVGSILTVLTAQAALDSARSQHASARWIWYSSLAQLSHDVGVIGIHGEPNLTLSGDSIKAAPR